MTGTDNIATMKTAIENIQSINSVYLPIVTLVYQEATFVYSTAHWTNWGNGHDIFTASSILNTTTLANLQPVSAPTGNSSTTSSSTSSSTSAQSSTASSSLSNTYLIAGVILVVIVAGSAIYVVNRGRSRSNPY